MTVKSFLRPLISGIMLGLMLTFPQQSAQAALDALTAFARSVLPVLFPFTACVLLFTAGRTLPLPALLLVSLLGGSPTGARLFAECHLTPPLARRIARATGTMSPMFFLGTLSVWLQNARAARLILICHLLSACVLALPLFRHKLHIRLPALPVPQALQQSAQAMLTVGACITLGAVGAQLFSCLLPHLPALPLACLQSLAEVTLGCKSLIAARPPLLLPILSACTAFSGLSILLQNAAFWGKKNIALADLALFGIFRAGISFLACFLILLCLPGGFAV